jgi:hypothetical protein
MQGVKNILSADAWHEDMPWENQGSDGWAPREPLGFVMGVENISTSAESYMSELPKSVVLDWR